jgi:hypothetical protein
VDICRQHLTLYLAHLRLLNTLWLLVGVLAQEMEPLIMEMVAAVLVVY